MSHKESMRGYKFWMLHSRSCMNCAPAGTILALPTDTILETPFYKRPEFCFVENSLQSPLAEHGEEGSPPSNASEKKYLLPWALQSQEMPVSIFKPTLEMLTARFSGDSPWSGTLSCFSASSLGQRETDGPCTAFAAAYLHTQSAHRDLMPFLLATWGQTNIKPTCYVTVPTVKYLSW